MEWLGDLGSAVLGAAYASRIPLTLGGIVAVVVLGVIARRRGWVDLMRRHPRRSSAILVPLLAIALPLGWYLASPLVLSASVDEPPPLVAAAPAASASVRPSDVPSIRPLPSVVPSGVEPSLTPTATPVALLERSGSFRGSDEFHFGRGTARLIETAPGTFVVRLEDFAVRNGPDLYVYLSPDPDGYADGAIELGRLKADTGNQNYPVPAGALTDSSDAASVVIWCKQFSHLFATAPLGG